MEKNVGNRVIGILLIVIAISIAVFAFNVGGLFTPQSLTAFSVYESTNNCQNIDVYCPAGYATIQKNVYYDNPTGDAVWPNYQAHPGYDTVCSSAEGYVYRWLSCEYLVFMQGTVTASDGSADGASVVCTGSWQGETQTLTDYVQSGSYGMTLVSGEIYSCSASMTGYYTDTKSVTVPTQAGGTFTGPSFFLQSTAPTTYTLSGNVYNCINTACTLTQNFASATLSCAGQSRSLGNNGESYSFTIADGTSVSCTYSTNEPGWSTTDSWSTTMTGNKNHNFYIYKDGPTCGDGSCATTENCGSCPADCPCSGGEVCQSGVCVPAVQCGDGVCEGSETYITCPQDCQSPCTDQCGAGQLQCAGQDVYQTCELMANGCYEWGANTQCNAGEYCQSGVCTTACNNNGVCEPANGEDEQNCPTDCYTPPNCPNGFCDADENYGNCPADCTNPCNNNGMCEPQLGEGVTNCPSDCANTCNNNDVCEADAGEKYPPCEDCKTEIDATTIIIVLLVIALGIVGILALMGKISIPGRGKK